MNNIDRLLHDIRNKLPKRVLYVSAYEGAIIERMEIKLAIRTTPIAWGIPMDETMYSKFMGNFFRLGYMTWDSIILTESTYLPDARNTIHNTFLEAAEASECSHLMMLDSDVLPPPNVVERLMSHKKDVVCGWYHTKKKDSHPCVYDYVYTDEKGVEQYSPRKEAGRGLEKIDGIGAGCILMSANAARKLGKNPYSMEKGGEDLTLCSKLRRLGIDIYVDWDIVCAHLGVFYV